MLQRTTTTILSGRILIRCFSHRRWRHFRTKRSRSWRNQEWRAFLIKKESPIQKRCRQTSKWPGRNHFLAAGVCWAMAESLRLQSPKLRRTGLGEPLGPVRVTWAEESLEGWEGSTVRVRLYLGSSPRDSRTTTWQYVWLVRILHDKIPPANVHISRSRLETYQAGPILESGILIPTIQRYGSHYGTPKLIVREYYSMLSL